VVAGSDLRRRWRGLRRHQVDGIGRPRLTGSFEMVHLRSPAEPDKETIKSNEEGSEGNNGNGSISSDKDQVIFNAIDTGGVELMTECKLIYSRNGELSSSLSQEFKGSVDSGIK
jgi:hypothetical protein